MKREQFVRELRQLAKAQGKIFEVFENQGKGSHYRIKCDQRMTTLKSGELTPTYMRLVRKQLDV
jgi:hypothetical protein